MSARNPAARLGAVLAVAWACIACGGGDSQHVEAPLGMVFVPRSVQVIDGETLRVPAFFADAHEVTNAEFARFVEATGYVTDSERIGDSVCFIEGAGPRGEAIFELVVGADWRHPEGPGSDIATRAEHPVVHASFNDAEAYARWAQKRLPKRHEWYAMARGDAADRTYPWGDSLEVAGHYTANTWQGVFPLQDEGLDGFRGTAPVGSFAPGTHGIYDLGGNVWEWVDERSHGFPAGADPALIPQQELAATRGGSFLCRERAAPPFHACHGYRIGTVEHKPLTDGNNQVGFRCVRDL